MSAVLQRRIKYWYTSYRFDFSMDRYAKFEAQKFKIFEEYGIYLEEGGDIFPYGKGKRIMHTSKQKQRYLIAYNELLEKYKK